MKSARSAISASPTQGVVPLRLVQARRDEELAFLPAALEIVETPPSPVGRKIVAVIILLFCAALVWSWWGTIDIVASAIGRRRPHQDHPAVRDGGSARDPGAGWSGGQGWRCPDRP
jgi:hemolysin D